MSVKEMKFSGISIEGHRDIGRGRLEIYFAIPAGKEDSAAGDILLCLAEGFEVLLHNDLDEGLEGLTILRISPAGMEMMTGGHGWRSDWKRTDETEVIAIVKALARLNRGGHWGTLGSFYRPAG